MLRPHVLLRAEFRDYLTTFPRQQIVPGPHNTARGLFEQSVLCSASATAFEIRRLPPVGQWQGLSAPTEGLRAYCKRQQSLLNLNDSTRCGC
jgi:hypothetical protein